MAPPNDEPNRPAKLGEGLFYALMGEAESLWSATVEFLNDHAKPEEIFDNDKLEAWAKARGFQIDE